MKRREAKSKGEKERYKHLNAEFQRIARRDMKAFLSDQCKEIEENKRMEKTRNLFKKIRDTKGTFHAKMGTIKDRNCMDGNPLQCSCLEDPRDRRAWWAAIYGVAQNRTRLKQLSSSSSNSRIKWKIFHFEDKVESRGSEILFRINIACEF